MRLLLLALLLSGCALSGPVALTSRPKAGMEACVAKRLSPAADTAASRLWGRSSRLWPQGSTLRVLFVGGDTDQQRRAWCRFCSVDGLVNLSFVRVATGPAEIRVAFAPDGGHWSYVGRDNLSVVSGPTMNLALSGQDDRKEWDRVAVHEILHAIGFMHEHQHPQAMIPWNMPVVLAYYRQTQGWTDAQIRYQVTDRRDPPDFIGSTWDKRSIMQYPVPRDHVLDSAYACGWNRRLTETDKATLRRIYP